MEEQTMLQQTGDASGDSPHSPRPTELGEAQGEPNPLTVLSPTTPVANERDATQKAILKLAQERDQVKRTRTDMG